MKRKREMSQYEDEEEERDVTISSAGTTKKTCHMERDENHLWS